MRSGPGKKDRRPAYGGGEARLRVSKQRRAGLGGVAQRRRGWAGAPGGRCQRRLHSAAMERPRGAADGLSRWPLGLLLLLQLLPPAAVGQDRLDAPPPPAPPPLRWAGPVGVSWGLRAAAPGGPVPRAGRWRRGAPAEDQGCGHLPDFVAKLTNNTHQVSARGPGDPHSGAAPPGLRPPAASPTPRCTLRGWRETPAAEGDGARGRRGSGWLRPAGLCVVTAEAIRDFHSLHSLLLLLKLSESPGQPRLPPDPTPNQEHRVHQRCYLPGSWRHNYPLSDCRRSWVTQKQRCAPLLGRYFWGVARLAFRNPTAVVRSRLVFP